METLSVQYSLFWCMRCWTYIFGSGVTIFLKNHHLPLSFLKHLLHKSKSKKKTMDGLETTHIEQLLHYNNIIHTYICRTVCIKRD